MWSVVYDNQLYVQRKMFSQAVGRRNDRLYCSTESPHEDEPCSRNVSTSAHVPNRNDWHKCANFLGCIPTLCHHDDRVLWLDLKAGYM